MSRRRGGKLPKAAGTPEYDPMYDQHLEMYFSMPAIKSQLVKAGFVRAAKAVARRHPLIGTAARCVTGSPFCVDAVQLDEEGNRLNPESTAGRLRMRDASKDEKAAAAEAARYAREEAEIRVRP